MSSKKILIYIVPALMVLTAVLYGIFAGPVKTTSPRVIIFGDSLIGNDRTDTSVTSLLEDKSGFSVFNAGIGGSLMTNGDASDKRWNYYNMVNVADSIAKDDFSSMLSEIPYDYLDYNVIIQYLDDTVKGLSQIDFSSVEYIVIEHGINDCIGGVSVEEFEKALKSVIENLRKASPNAKLIVVSPGYTVTLEGNSITEEYVAAEKRICTEQNVSFIDFYHNSGINSDNYTDYLYDGLHTNAGGNNILANMIYEKIME